MAERDSNTIVLNRPTILLVTGVGVGLLTLTYVLGVQVGKQSAAMKLVRSSTSGEDLNDLPASLDEQLKQIEAMEKTKRESHGKSSPKADVQKTENKSPEARHEVSEAKAEVKPEAKIEGKWTVQLVAASKEKEAKLVAEKAEKAGFHTVTVKEGGKYKVRLAKSGPRADMDVYMNKLKAKGLEAFPLKAD